MESHCVPPSKIFREVLRTADEYARSEWPVLLLGETGVGKEFMAQRIHQHSTRRSEKFSAINCGAMPINLFESELFGYERGAFSGALQSFRGLLRTTDGGTLLLDEVGDLDPLAQVKLLRWLDGGEVRAIGSTKSDKVNVRVVAATNANLYQAIGSGDFRQDLFERLSVLLLRIPPLRERPEDIAFLASYFMGEWEIEGPANWSPALLEYEWPGNIRQLRNVLARASVLGRRRIENSLLEKLLMEERAQPRGTAAQVNVSLADLEKKVIVEKLKECHGNRKQAARQLGIAKSTLHEKLRRWKKELGEEVPWPISRWVSSQ